jgi:hypothetical protein
MTTLAELPPAPGPAAGRRGLWAEIVCGEE